MHLLLWPLLQRLIFKCRLTRLRAEDCTIHIRDLCDSKSCHSGILHYTFFFLEHGCLELAFLNLELVGTTTAKVADVFSLPNIFISWKMLTYLFCTHKSSGFTQPKEASLEHNMARSHKQCRN